MKRSIKLYYDFFDEFGRFTTEEDNFKELKGGLKNGSN